MSMSICHAQGPDALYLQHADDLAAEIKAAGGIVTAQDLRDAAPLLKEPLTIKVRYTSPFYLSSRLQLVKRYLLQK